ncbi:MAG: AmmeMemoRadiSam system protein B [Patescibacteria group bacterium]|nr:AmmeMemoRadiSam system protein B [Patescibacteria group bacterium]
MSLNFAAISPHPPIIIPEIGTAEDLQKAAMTVQAMKKMAFAFQKAEIDTLIVISPHMLIYPDKFNICGMKKLFGSFANSGAPEIIVEANNNLDLAHEIDRQCNIGQIKSLIYDNEGEFFELDHGIMVPLYYLNSLQESSFKVVPIAYSNLSRADHFSFGEIIQGVCKKYPGRIGIISSGDLSHRLNHGSSEELKAGREFDQKLAKDLEQNNTQEILSYDEDFVDQAGECGYRSILILLGALSGLQVSPNILSHEGPFGVGYLVGNYTIPE